MEMKEQDEKASLQEGARRDGSQEVLVIVAVGVLDYSE